MNKPMKGHQAKAGKDLYRTLKEFPLEAVEEYELGQEITVDIFAAGEKVKVTGTSKGKGFQGVMKRHNFAGSRASHGAEKVHRVPGSVGNATFPGRVWKGKKMPGQMGNARVTVSNVEIVDVRSEDNVLVVKGADPRSQRRSRDDPQERLEVSIMAKLQIIDQNNKKVGDIELAPEVFEVEIQPEILNLVVRSQRAAKRQGTHATKNRALITGGGRKPWRQKGTGRARAGSSRSPLWRGGATTFGPPAPRLHLQGEQEGPQAGPADGPVLPRLRREAAGGQHHRAGPRSRPRRLPKSLKSSASARPSSWPRTPMRSWCCPHGICPTSRSSKPTS